MKSFSTERKMKKSAVVAFAEKKAKIDEMLARIQAMSDEHFDLDPDSVSWGDVGSLGHIAESLKEISDFVFCEDEFED